MATLVLTALGSAIGGSIGAIGGAVGGMVGALAGQAIDSAIFRPAGRTGPRLSDLQVQTSRYGARIPRLFGALRVAGTVIWSTDLQEASTISGGGKGQPSVTQYSYSASFAVALSARPIRNIGRIWADGNLLRGNAGDFKSPIGDFRVHHGEEGQALDPLIAAAMGIDTTPAYRGCAYVVFEQLQLADFGNRIPSLTLEVFADEGPVALSVIVSDLAGQAVDHHGDAPEATLIGFAGEGSDVRDAAAPLAEMHGLQWREQNGVVMLTSGRWADRDLAAQNEIRAIDDEPQSARSKQRLPIEAVPARFSVRHHDPARDYQIGVQTAERAGPGQSAEEVDLPAVLDASDGRKLADQRLRAAMRGRTIIRRAVGWAALDLAVGDMITLSDEPGRWLVEACDWEDMAVRLTLRAAETGPRPIAVPGESGGPVLQNDMPEGETHVAIVELPPDGHGLATAPAVFVGATGADAGWRRAALFRYRADMEIAEPIGRTALRAILGTAATVLPDGVPWRIDRRSSVEIVLDNAADVLVATDDMALLSSSNLCQIGDEILQFGAATLIAPRRYRLSHLIRGRSGTEWACAVHGDDERFVLLDPTRLASVTLAQSDVGHRLNIRAIGGGDSVPAEAERLIDGRAMMPVSPVHGQVATSIDGDRLLQWVRRSRLGWNWPDEGDVPLGEEVEAYVVRVDAGDNVLREWEVAAPHAIYSASDLAADLVTADPTPLTLQIRQKGLWGMSRPLIIDLP